MNARGMLAHVSDSYRMALGDLHVKPKNLPLRYPPLKQFVIYAMPFPKGAPTAPALIARCAGASLADEQHAYAELLARLAAVIADTQLQDHPAIVFDTRTGRRAHALSVSLGVTSVIMALTMPMDWRFSLSGMIYALEGPFQVANGWLRGTQRGRLFPSQPAAVPPD